MINELMTHLWQSTLFALAAALLTLAFRRNRAKVRFSLWLSASLKFFIPFAFLVNLGSHIQWTQATHQIVTEYATPAVSFAVEYVALPFSATPAPAVQRSTEWLPVILLSVWACGFLAILMIRLNLWRRVRAAVHASTPLDIPAAVGVRSAPGLLEPGVVGLLKPVLLLPEGIVDRLTPSQLEAVLAHELCHVRRRDNLFAAVHMIAEAVFWFHPLVWWIGARMVDERERACDEDVLNLGNQPRVYADAILNVCKLYAESPLVCVSGVTGADIRGRIEAIMTNRRGQTLNSAKKMLLAIAGVAALACPVIVGIIIGFGHVPAILAQSPLAPMLQTPVAAPTVLAQSTPAGPLPRPADPPAVEPATPSSILRYNDRSLTVMLFDFNGMTPEDQARARTAGIQRVQAMTPPNVTAVMLAGDALEVVQDFTDNKTLLQTAIQNLSARGNGTVASGPQRLAIIQTAAKMLGAFNQKKALMYFSTSIAQTGDENQTALKNAIDAAKKANVAIFPIDVRPAGSPELESFVKKQLDDLQTKIEDQSRQYGPDAALVKDSQALLDELKRRYQGQITATPSGGGRSMTPPAPGGVSMKENMSRVLYAEANFGSATKSPMGRSYVRYGAPDQIENPTATAQIWRYKYLDDFQGGAAFEFSGQFGARVIYPPPVATYVGQPGQASQFAPFAEALIRDSPAAAKSAPTNVTPGLPGGRHISLQIDTVTPGMPPASGKFAASFAVPLDSLSGQVDVAAQLRARADAGVVGQMAGALRDTVQASAVPYQAAFTVPRGAWTLNVLVRELATGRMFDETVNFDVK